MKSASFVLVLAILLHMGMVATPILLKILSMFHGIVNALP